MVTLPELNEYSSEDRERFNNFSPILARYSMLAEKPANSFSDEIRIQKHKHWLKCAYATLAGDISAEEVCLYWSHEADVILEKVWKHCELDREPVALFALGKLGSMELNLSSDIDIVFVCEEDAPIQTINPKVKKFIRLVSESTPLGFVFRVDTDLRPGGDLSPLVPNIKNFTNYYDEYLEAWHRLSFIRLRGMFGKQSLIDSVTNYCKGMAFPRHLDFSVFEEIHELRSKLKTQWRKSHEPFDLKYHPGGIRDIELYIHALQVIYGGRHKQLQNSSISIAFSNLLAIEVLSEENSDFLLDFYWQLRSIENLIHTHDDQHSYLLRKEIHEKWPLPVGVGQLQASFKKADKLIATLIDGRKIEQTNSTAETLSEKGQNLVKEISDLKSHALKRSALQSKKSKILDHFVKSAQEVSIDPDLAVELFRDLVFSIKAKSSFFYLLGRHPELVENLAWLFSLSPFVGQVLVRRPELLDSFVLGRVDINPDEADTELLLDNLMDYKLLGQLLATVHLLRNNSVDQYCRQLSEQADFIASTLIGHLSKQRNCPPLELLCMGKWSGSELGIQSDLDFIFLTKDRPSIDQSKVARRFINLLTNPGRGGRLYNIDLRLKPDESSGPLIIEEDQFSDFLKNRAAAWQKQAYLRSRRLSDSTFPILKQMKSLWISKENQTELEEIQAKLLTKPNKDRIDVKTDPGGLLHTEFTTQRLVLSGGFHPESPRTFDIMSCIPGSSDMGEELYSNYQFIRKIEQVHQIIASTNSTKVLLNGMNAEKIQKIVGVDNLEEALTDKLDSQVRLLNTLT